MAGGVEDVQNEVGLGDSSVLRPTCDALCRRHCVDTVPFTTGAMRYCSFVYGESRFSLDVGASCEETKLK